MMKSQINTPGKICKVLAILLSLLFVFEQSGFAQIAGQLDISSHLANLRNAFTPDVFRPLHLRYLSYNPTENNFQLFLDKGSLKNPTPQELEDTTKTLLNYFFVGVTLPNDTFWVNLRPDAEDNIIDDRLAQTDVGRIMLETDLQLKKDTARFTSPETSEGREYWDKLYKKAGEIFGSENITIPTLTRPWIVPDEIIISETTDSAYIYKATLKVMLEQDYLKDSTAYSFKDEHLKSLNEYSSQLIREIIIPKLTKEINSSKRYASLRQVYYSLIMAQWFKARFKGLSPQIANPAQTKGTVPDHIDSQNLTNLTSKEPWTKTTYFQAYQKSFKDGEYNIKEPIYTPYGQTIRSYFSGGISGIAPTMPNFGETFIDPKTEAASSSIVSPLSPSLNHNVIGVKVDATDMPDEVEKVELLPPNPEKEQLSVASSAVEQKPIESSSPASNTFIIEELARLNTLYSNGLNRSSIEEMGLSEMHGNILRNTKTGKTILIMGKSGSGKTFLSYLLTQSSGEEWEFLADDWLLGKIFYIKDKAFLLVGFNSSLYAGSELIKYRTGPGTYDFRFIPLHSKKEFVNIDGVVNLESTGLEHKKAIGDISINTLSGVGILIVTFKREEQYSDRLYFEGIISELSRNFGSPIAASSVVEQTSVSSPVDTKGGIDFRSLPIVTQAVGNLSANIGNFSINRLSSINLDTEWQQIENLVNSDIIPSAERIKEYVQASCYKERVNRDIDKVISCISDILRIEEEHYSSTDPTLKDILVVLNSSTSVQQLKAVFIGTHLK